MLLKAYVAYNVVADYEVDIVVDQDINDAVD